MAKRSVSRGVLVRLSTFDVFGNTLGAERCKMAPKDLIIEGKRATAAQARKFALGILEIVGYPALSPQDNERAIAAFKRTHPKGRS